MKVGDHVRVSTEKPFKDGKHPHAGKTGTVNEIMSLFAIPRAVVELDIDQELAGHFIIVTLPYLEEIP